MKKHFFFLFNIILSTILCINDVQSQVNVTPVISADNKIVINVAINIAPQGNYAFSVDAIQFPSTLTTNGPIPLEVNYVNESMNTYDLKIVHLGSKIDIQNQITGGVVPIRIPPNGTSSSDPVNSRPSQVIYNQVPQQTAGYLFGHGDHELNFILLESEETNISTYLKKTSVHFSIIFSSNGNFRTPVDTSLAYPNPFADKITFDITNLKPQIQDNAVSITIYDQYGRIQDQIRKNISDSSKIVYLNNTLLRGNYYYIITNNKGQKIDSGILLKQ